jgi:uncharacterized membrane protein (DUF485 family)
MAKVFKFNAGYFSIAILLFITEILIALYVHDTFVRPTIGDLLVVILIYCFVKSFLNTPLIPTAIAVLLFSFAIETAQYFHIVTVLGLQQNKLARTVIGTSFEWTDLLAYTAGIIVVIIVEKMRSQKALQ